MVKTKITIKVTTLSNLFIGGSPTTFEIGGVDLFTVTNEQGLPLIPASSFKGSLRSIVRELLDEIPDATKIKKGYIEYLSILQQKTEEERVKFNIEGERIERMNERYRKAIESASAECLFGIEGFNDTPKIIFNDLLPEVNTKQIDDYFSIDSKNTIEYKAGPKPEVSANPRTYRVVRPGVSFVGDILLYKTDKLKLEGISMEQSIVDFIKHAMNQFNRGIYRLGNSGSRGYGRVQIDIVGESDQHG